MLYRALTQEDSELFCLLYDNESCGIARPDCFFSLLSVFLSSSRRRAVSTHYYFAVLLLLSKDINDNPVYSRGVILGRLSRCKLDSTHETLYAYIKQETLAVFGSVLWT